MKHVLSLLSIAMAFCCYGQTIKNFQYPVTKYNIHGELDREPSEIVFTEENKEQRTVIYLPVVTEPLHPEVYMQEGSGITFDVTGSGQVAMIQLKVNWDNTGWNTLFSEQTKGNYGWFPNTTNALGKHELKVHFFDVFGYGYTRTYDVFVVPTAAKYYMDNHPNTNAAFRNKLTVWEKNDGVSNKKPVIIVEGFNPSNTLHSEYYRHVANDIINPFQEKGYRVYILDFAINGQNMLYNSKVVHNAIEYVSSLNNDQKVLLAGISMGGVICRYTLAKDEEVKNEQSSTSYLPDSDFLSIDSPQRGARISSRLLDFMHKEQPDHFIMTRTATKQLLSPPNAFNEGDHEAFYSMLQSTNGNGYPTHCRSLGVAFSRPDIPNPNNGQFWYEIVGKFLIAPIRDVQFRDNIADLEAVPGSLLPSTTGLGNDVVDQMLGFPVAGELRRHSHPTFIPYESALDFKDGVSGFCATIETGKLSPQFHDRIPEDLPLAIMNYLEAGTLTSIPANRKYNIAPGVSSVIVEDLTIEGQMLVNGDQQAGFDNDPRGPMPSNSHFKATTSCYCEKLEFKSGSTLTIGRNTSTTAALHVSNDEMVFRTGAALYIKENSTLTLSPKTKLTVEPGADITVERGGLLDIQGELDWLATGSTLVIKGGGTVKIHKSDDLNFTSTASLVVDNNGSLVLGKEAPLNYALGTAVKLNGAESSLEIQGQVNIAENAVFTFTADPGYQLGVLKLNPTQFSQTPEWQKLIVSGVGAKIILPRKGKDVKTLEVLKNVVVPPSVLLFDAEDAGIYIAKGQFLGISSYNFNVDNTKITGGTLTLYPRNESLSATVNNTIFDNANLSDITRIANKRPVVTNCIFKNNSSLIENGLGIEVYNCSFEDGSGIKLNYSRLVNKIEGCSFSANTGSTSSGNTAIDIRNYSFVTTTFHQNGITGYSKGLNLGNFVTSHLSCNYIGNNYYGIVLNIDATAYLDNGVNSSNSITDQIMTNFQVLYGNAPVTKLGGNEVYNSRTGGRIFWGSINNYVCKPAANSIEIPGNCWQMDNCSLQPQSPLFDQSKFELKGFSNLTCDDCKLIIADNTPKSRAICVQIQEPVLPFVPEIVRCPTCPVIFTSDFNGVNLAHAVQRADLSSTLALPKTGDDEKALSLYEQILTYPYYVKNQTTYKWLIQACKGAKYAAAELVLKGEKALAEAKMYAIYQKFQPVQYSGHTELEVPPGT